MIQQNIINDLSTYTRVSNKILTELVKKTNLCIGSAIHDAKQNKEDAISLNIGIGTLGVNLADMQCKFVPSKDLKQTIKASLTGEIDPLELALDEALVEKLKAICEEVL